MRKLSNFLVYMTAFIFCLLFVMLCFIAVFWLFEFNLDNRFYNVFETVGASFIISFLMTILIYREH
ncbi:MAG: hypothetical protein ACJAVA_000295 [Flavobacteriaceae bacterium]|jgi:hypothetical protein